MKNNEINYIGLKLKTKSGASTLIVKEQKGDNLTIAFTFNEMDYHHQWITKTTLQENSIEELEKNISDGLWIIVPESNSNQSETMLYNGKPIYNHEQLIAFTMHYSGMKREAVEIQIKRYFINGLR